MTLQATEEILEEQMLRDAYERMPSSLAATLGLMLASCALLWPFFGPLPLALWVLAVVVVLAARYLQVLAFRRAPLAHDALPRWRVHLTAGAALTGIVLSAGTVSLLHRGGGGQSASLVIIAMLALIAVSLSALMAQRGAFGVFVLAALLPVISFALLGGGESGIALGLMLGIALLSMLFAGRLGRARLRTSVESEMTRFAAERRLTAIVDASPAIIYSCDYGGQWDVTFISGKVKQMFGYEPDECMRGGWWVGTLHPQERARVLEGLVSLAEHGHHTHEYRMATKSGDWRWVRDELSLVRLDDGTAHGLVGAILDITRSREMEEQLREAQKLEAIGQLTGGLAHDFNNLLGIVVGNLDELGERLPQDKELRDRHRAALDAAERSVEVTRSLLAVARRQPLEIGWHDLNELIVEMMALLRASAGAALPLRSQLTAGRLMVRVDAHGLSSAVLNLVINARDALQDAPGEPAIMLRSGRARIDAADQHADLALTPGWYAVLELSDTGKGMSEMVRARAFEPFFTTKVTGKGTGLGLAMVHGFATQLGGTARIRSQVGAGTTVELYLPLDPEGAAADEAAEAQRLAALQGRAILDTAPDRARSAPRVLVVDDEEALCELAWMWLESLGYVVGIAHSPAQALQRLAAEEFDVLFTDIIMPGGIDGRALAVKALELQPGLRVLFASGYVQGLHGEGDLPGPLLSKPYRKQDLAAAFERLAPTLAAPCAA